MVRTVDTETTLRLADISDDLQEVFEALWEINEADEPNILGQLSAIETQVVAIQSRVDPLRPLQRKR